MNAKDVGQQRPPVLALILQTVLTIGLGIVVSSVGTLSIMLNELEIHRTDSDG